VANSKSKKRKVADDDESETRHKRARFEDADSGADTGRFQDLLLVTLKRPTAIYSILRVGDSIDAGLDHPSEIPVAVQL
jgi:hypothetical protein